MKAISILTLTFLPSTFVSTVFSTTIFDFQNWQSESGGVSSTTNGGGRVASPGWWIYLVCCVLLTALVFAIWFPWDRWSSRKFALENRPEDMEAQREDEDIVVDWASIS
ncbi:hypothetical protein K432DRAFT_384474 [Lepidopterella palustris CBS 459.81]|uniref:Uncharacterized protein n=1 Tax=Lepidopterella palustris CBS 459.81 TaxID=1314670 RepID=A0A8E2E5G2_9PEZI|nr:hypothetical protein K432DRAFT_384474 [Lepidopterella palustris CBS 459.81]